jgi:hypothetical protein
MKEKILKNKNKKTKTNKYPKNLYNKMMKREGCLTDNYSVHYNITVMKNY